MNINQMTAKIGQDFSKNQDPLDSIIKHPKLKDGKEGYVVKLIFDIPKDEIRFELFKKHTEKTAKEFHYFGNNPAAGLQYYLVRESGSLNYLLGSSLSDLALMLKRNGMEDRPLNKALKKLAQRDFVELADKKGKGKVHLQKLLNCKDRDINLDKKKIKVDTKEYNYEAFIKYLLDEDELRGQIVLVVPEVIDETGELFEIVKSEDYREIVIIENNLGASKKSKKPLAKRICHLCGHLKDDVSSNYSAKFNRSGINKIFTTTTINHSDFNRKYSYDNSYGICNECYNHLLSGEKIVGAQFTSRIANESVFIIPEGLTADFDYRRVKEIKEDVNLAFNHAKGVKWFQDLDYRYRKKLKNYSINLVFYRSDGTSLSIMETIEDVPAIRLVDIAETIETVKKDLNLRGRVTSFSLGKIYWLIPVRTNKKGEQLDIKRVISLYDAILSGYFIDAKTIFTYYTEALDKGTKQLGKAQMDNYQNLNLRDYKQYGDIAPDYFIKEMTKNYLLLFKTLEALGSIRKIFTGEESRMKDKLVTASERVNAAFEEMEDFLERQGFSREAKALFYLGAMLNKVAMAQYAKGHRKKPILKKIQFQGMTIREVDRFYKDICEKLIQYEKMDLFADALLNRFHLYSADIKENWNLDEHSNVFFIMAGYSYMTGRWDKAGEQEQTEGFDYDKEEEREND